MFLHTAALALMASFSLQPAEKKEVTEVDPFAVLRNAPDSAWIDIPADELMIWTFADDNEVVIRLAPDFAPVHVENLRVLARSGYWDTARIHRVVDDFVTQWGTDEDPLPWPDGAVMVPPAEYERDVAGLSVTELATPDPFAPLVGFANGWPISVKENKAAIAYCYGIVGVARNEAPDTGNGGDLFTIIGKPPRRLDRHLAVVGKVIEGMDYLSARTRGAMADNGSYKDKIPQVPVTSVVMASDLPEDKRPHFQFFDTERDEWHSHLAAIPLRQNSFYTVPAGGMYLCDAPVPARRKPAHQ